MTMSKKIVALVVAALLVLASIVVFVFILRRSLLESSATMSDGDVYGGQDAMMVEESFALGMARQAAPSESYMPEPPTTASNNTTLEEDRLIIKNADLSLVVEDVPLGVAQVHQQTAALGGFVVSSNVYKYGQYPRADVTVKIPVANFDSMVSDVTVLGTVESKQITGQDVTEEFVDIEAQIGNLRSTEQQFLSIMKQATRIDDILAVQRELSAVRSQIERMQGRINYLEKSAALSTVTIHLSTNPESLPVVTDQDQWKPLAVVKDALRSLRGVGIGIANAVIWLVIYIPFWIVLGILGVFVYRRLRVTRMK